MIIKKINIKNLRLIEELSVPLVGEFTDGINIVVGKNGVGKSTLAESVGLALYHAHDNSKIKHFLKKEMNDNDTQTTMSIIPEVEIVFEHEQRKYQLIKKFNEKNGFSIVNIDDNGKYEAYKEGNEADNFMNKLLNPSEEKLNMGNFSGKKEKVNFRTSVLEKGYASTLYSFQKDRKLDLLSDYGSEVKDNLQNLFGEFVIKENDENFINNIKDKYDTYFTPKGDINSDQKKADSEIFELNEKLKEFEEREHRYQTIVKESKLVNKKTENINSSIKNIEQNIAEINKELQSPEIEESLRKEKGDDFKRRETKLNESKKEIVKLENIEDQYFELSEGENGFIKERNEIKNLESELKKFDLPITDKNYYIKELKILNTNYEICINAKKFKELKEKRARIKEKIENFNLVKNNLKNKINQKNDFFKKHDLQDFISEDDLKNYYKSQNSKTEITLDLNNDYHAEKIIKNYANQKLIGKIKIESDQTLRIFKTKEKVNIGKLNIENYNSEGIFQIEFKGDIGELFSIGSEINNEIKYLSKEIEEGLQAEEVNKKEFEKINEELELIKSELNFKGIDKESHSDINVINHKENQLKKDIDKTTTNLEKVKEYIEKQIKVTEKEKSIDIAESSAKIILQEFENDIENLKNKKINLIKFIETEEPLYEKEYELFIKSDPKEKREKLEGKVIEYREQIEEAKEVLTFARKDSNDYYDEISQTDLEEIEENIDSLKIKKRELSLKILSIKILKYEIDKFIKKQQTVIAKPLKKTIEPWIKKFWGGNREVHIGPEGVIDGLIQINSSIKTFIDVDDLSEGELKIIKFLSQFAFAKLLMNGNKTTYTVIFDDPFTDVDDDYMKYICQILESESEDIGCPVIIFTKDENQFSNIKFSNKIKIS